MAGVIVLALLLSGYWYLSRQQSPTKQVSSPAQSSDSTPPPPSAPPSLTFAAMGDMLAHDSVVAQAKTANGYDFTSYFSQIRPLYEGSDVIFCNPETPAAGAAYGISGYPTFNAPTEFARDLSRVGCNLINMASNHATDKGQAALNATLDEWDKHKPLAITGANRSLDEQRTVRYFEKNGMTVAFLAFADFSNGPIPYGYSLNRYHNTDLVRELMSKARKKADAVVVSMHWGTEDSHTVNADQRAAAKLVADLGADVIIGTGPHVLQPVEWVKRASGGRTLVWYSIGNMLSSQLQVDELTGGVAKYRLTKTADGVSVSDIAFTGTFMSYEWSAADQRAQRLEARRNLRLQPLASAGQEVRLFGVTADERRQKLHEWLGNSVEMTITP